MPAKKTSPKSSPKLSQKSASQSGSAVMEEHALDPELTQFLKTFLTSSVIADKLRAVETNTKNKMAPIIKKVDQYEKTASTNELALFEFVTNYGLSEMYNKSLMALILNFSMNGEAASTEITKQIEKMLLPITLPENRKRTAYVFKEWLIDHAQDAVQRLANSKRPARSKR